MHALLLSLALGQAAGAPPGHSPASRHGAGPGGPAAPAAAGRRSGPSTSRGSPTAASGPRSTAQPVAGADFYRAVLRPDLAARAEEARFQRTALFIAAGVAPVAGLGIGWVAGTAHQWPLPPCVGEPPGPVDCRAHDQVAKQNQSAMTTALVAGGVAGLATGVPGLAAGERHPPARADRRRGGGAGPGLPGPRAVPAPAPASAPAPGAPRSGWRPARGPPGWRCASPSEAHRNRKGLARRPAPRTSCLRSADYGATFDAALPFAATKPLAKVGVTRNE